MSNIQKKCKVLNKVQKGFTQFLKIKLVLCISTKLLGVHMLKLSEQLAKYRNTLIHDDTVHRSQQLPFPLSDFKPVILLR